MSMADIRKQLRKRPIYIIDGHVYRFKKAWSERVIIADWPGDDISPRLTATHEFLFAGLYTQRENVGDFSFVHEVFVNFGYVQGMCTHRPSGRALWTLTTVPYHHRRMSDGTVQHLERRQQPHYGSSYCIPPS
jgi:hypothetical protein